MDKIFHVFVSSTFSDLINERKKVSEAVAKAGYVAEGMEIFPASSQHQMDFIERVIDRCDYYILILAGRYGSVADDGLSFTEKEFHYAKSKGIPVLAFIRDGLDELPSKHTEKDVKSQAKLKKLIEALKSDTLVDFWTNPDELSTKALAALSQARANFEAVGWIRADIAASVDILNEINDLRKSNDELRAELSTRKPAPIFGELELAGLDEEFEFGAKISSHRGSRKLKISVSWREILATIGTSFRTASNTSGLDSGLRRVIRKRHVIGDHDNVSIDIGDKDRILIQMEALGMMRADTYSRKSGGSFLFHKLTEAGLAQTLRENVVKSSK